MAFADPFTAGDDVFYNLAYPGTPEYPRSKWEFDATIDALKAKSSLGTKRALEIGAGVGNFLDHLRNIGLVQENLQALEFNAESLKTLRAKGYKAEATNFLEWQASAPYDFVFMFQVLEHMDNLDEIFDKISEVLAPGGQAYVAVPNRARIDFNEAHGSLLDMPPNHISRWSVNSFEAILRRHDLELVASTFEPGRFLQFVKQDLTYRCLRRSMDDDTVMSRAYAMRQSGSPPGKMLFYGLVALTAIGRLPLWIRALGQLNDLGGSLLVVLQSKRPA